MSNVIKRVEAVLEEIKAGKGVILVDDEDRENEGDIVVAAEKVTPESINFMATHARGLICLAMTEEHIDRLALPMMVDDNRASRSTAFTISIEARHGVTTGISAADRSHTIQTAINPDVASSDIVSPGHVFPLKAVPGGVLQRTGHTEGSIDLARMAGLNPAGVICEIMKEDGTMARYPDLVEFGKKHDLMILSIADMVEYRLSRECLVKPIRSEEVTLPTGNAWTAHVYEVAAGDQPQFMALTYGKIDREPTLVRVHTGSVLGDAFQVRMGNRVYLSDSVAAIEAAGKGVILFLPGHPDPATDIAFYLGENIERPRQDTGIVLREYGLGAQILAAIGMGKMRVLTNRPRRIASLDGYGLEVVEQLLVKTGGELVVAEPPTESPS